jgi:hypothetical protein
MAPVEIRSKKSNSIYTVSGTEERAFLTVTGEAYSKAKVQKEIARIRRSGSDFDTAVWTAKMLASTY